MVVIADKIVLICLITFCFRVHPSPTTKFNFKKVFKTPKENYESRIAELDKCEILERSNFSSEDDDKSTETKPKDDPKVIANAEIHVRFGCDLSRPENDKTTQGQDKFHHYTYTPTPAYPPYYPPPYIPYNPFGFAGYPYGHAQPPSPYSACLGPAVYPGWYNPYYQHPGFAQPFPPAPYSPKTSQSATICTTEQKPKLPPMYCQTNNNCATTPKWEDVQNQPVSELTEEELAAIGELFDEPGEPSITTTTEPTTLTPTTQITSPPVAATQKPEPTSPENITTCPTITSVCPQEPAYICFEDDIVLEIVEEPPICEDPHYDDCLRLSDKLEFVKINLSDITNACPYEDECDDTIIYDMDDLYQFRDCPTCVKPLYQQPHYPTLPYMLPEGTFMTYIPCLYTTGFSDPRTCKLSKPLEYWHSCEPNFYGDGNNYSSDGVFQIVYPPCIVYRGMT